MDRKLRDVVVQAGVPLLMSTSGMQTDTQVVAVVTPKPSYVSLATQARLVPTGPRNGTSGGPVPLSGGAGPQPVGARALVAHGVLPRMSIDENFWRSNRLTIGVGERVLRAR